MAKRRRKPPVSAPLNIERLMGYTRYEMADNGMEFTVRHIRAARKEYVCPGCQGRIMVGEAHVVAWTEDSWFGPTAGQEARRHWHTSCWKARGHQATAW
ncbi:ATP/GTP-binding protein [Trueperella sp. LYQ143]|uniref:ATP/GTP-binding protein n=1 Tax=unclassified Trueperella TaxID=2630174 RepID=UPI003983082F